MQSNLSSSNSKGCDFSIWFSSSTSFKKTFSALLRCQKQVCKEYGHRYKITCHQLYISQVEIHM